MRFEWGLCHEIIQQLYVSELDIYSAIVAKAQLIERNIRIFFPIMGNSRLPIPHCRSTLTALNQQNKRLRPAPHALPQAPIAGYGKICQYYGKDHGNQPCYRLNNTCCICRTVQYYARECSRNQNQVRPAVQSRVYTLIQHDAEANQDVIQSMYTICRHLTHILIDISALHSFVSHVFIQYLNILYERLNSVLLVSTPRNRTLLKNAIYKSCIIKIVGRELSIDLIALDQEILI